jgi:hypothetical protein
MGQREDAMRQEAAETVAFPMGMSLVLLPIVGVVTGVIAVVAGPATLLPAVLAAALVTLQLRAIEYSDEHRRRRGPWIALVRAATLPFTVAPTIASRAACYPILGWIVPIVGATITFWWPAVVLAVCERLIRRIT